MRQTLCNHCGKWFVSSLKFCRSCYEEIPEDEQKKSFNIHIYKAYTSKDFDGTVRRVTGTSDENKLLERFGLIRHEDFKKMHPVSKQQLNMQELAAEKGKPREGIKIGAIDEETFTNQIKQGRVA